MSKFYGTVMGSADTAATRRGSDQIKVAAQSWDGSIITKLRYNKNGDLMVQVEYAEGSETIGRTIFDGTINEYINRLKEETR